MAITCVWCWMLLDVLSNISDCPRLQNRFLDTLCKGQSHACWRASKSCTIAVLFTVLLQKAILCLRSIQDQIRSMATSNWPRFRLARLSTMSSYLGLNILLFVRIPFLMVSDGTPAGPTSTDGSLFLLTSDMLKNKKIHRPGTGLVWISLSAHLKLSWACLILRK